MPEWETSGRQPEWALMYAFHDAFRHDLDALLATGVGPAAVRTRWAIFSAQPKFHHTDEDQVMWPPVRAKLPATPIGRPCWTRSRLSMPSTNFRRPLWPRPDLIN